MLVGLIFANVWLTSKPAVALAIESARHSFAAGRVSDANAASKEAF
jgi:hypothetical protein